MSPVFGPANSVSRDTIRAVQWRGDHLRLLDQRRLPHEEVWLDCRSADDVVRAIRDLVVRGAPAIGIAAAWGVALAARRGDDLESALAKLRAARPTAVNLMWALDRMCARVHGGANAQVLAEEAQKIQDEDLAANRRMGELGAALIEPGSAVLTHCNTGSLATAGFGTALGVIRAGVEAGRIARVYAGETRPWLQGARLTMWELTRDGIPATLIADSAAAHLMRQHKLQWVIVGADRIAANGDTANKIGTYGLAVLAQAHGIPLYVVAPRSTVDLALADGDGIPIEERAPDEVTHVRGVALAPEGVHAANPAFDVTPARYISAIITEAGIARAPYTESLAKQMSAAEMER